MADRFDEQAREILAIELSHEDRIADVLRVAAANARAMHASPAAADAEKLRRLADELKQAIGAQRVEREPNGHPFLSGRVRAWAAAQALGDFARHVAALVPALDASAPTARQPEAHCADGCRRVPCAGPTAQDTCPPPAAESVAEAEAERLTAESIDEAAAIRDEAREGVLMDAKERAALAPAGDVARLVEDIRAGLDAQSFPAGYHGDGCHCPWHVVDRQARVALDVLSARASAAQPLRSSVVLSPPPVPYLRDGSATRESCAPAEGSAPAPALVAAARRFAAADRAVADGNPTPEQAREHGAAEEALQAAARAEAARHPEGWLTKNLRDPEFVALYEQALKDQAEPVSMSPEPFPRAPLCVPCADGFHALCVSDDGEPCGCAYADPVPQVAPVDHKGDAK